MYITLWKDDISNTILCMLLNIERTNQHYNILFILTILQSNSWNFVLSLLISIKQKFFFRSSFMVYENIKCHWLYMK